MSKLNKLAFAMTASTVIFTGMAQASDEAPKARSAEDIAKVCAACHGPDGNAVIPTYPSLAGQYANYLVKALGDYKADKRNGGQAAVMAGQAKALSETEMEVIADYFSKMESKLVAVPAK